MGDQIIMFISQIFNGLKIGSVYSLVALGYTMVYGIIRLINFAHGDFIMVGSYVLMLFDLYASLMPSPTKDLLPHHSSPGI